MSRELTNAEYSDIFGTTNRDRIRQIVLGWNAASPSCQIPYANRMANGTITLSRDESLPRSMEGELRRNEASGTIYDGAGRLTR
jgi:hypothetical protein